MKIAQYVKGKTSRKILQENPRLNKPGQDILASSGD